MKNFNFIIFLIFSCKISSQNLIPNPGFDDIIQCPSDYHQIDLAPPWFKANNGLVDLYNECATISLFSVPNGGLYIDSYQEQRSGEGYAGIFVFNNDNIVKYGYIETPLLSELIKGQNYYIEFYVSPDLGALGYWHYTDAVGLALTDSAYYKDINPHEALPLEPVIENRGILIKDTIGWTRISGCFTAKGGEKFAIIGNFRNEYETILEAEDPAVYPYINYFYIEDVLISIFDPLPDTLVLCKNESLNLSAGFLNATYLWNTGESDSTIMVQSEGQYVVQAFMDNCILSDTVIVVLGDTHMTLDKDTIYCADETLILSADIVGSYSWSTGAIEKQIAIQTDGIYIVTVTNICGEYVFTYNVHKRVCDCNFYVPNIISINNDGINDEFSVDFNCDFPYTILDFNLFDRWGGIVATAKGEDVINLYELSRNNPLSSGVYVWTLEYEIMQGNKIEKKVAKGDITIIK